MSPRSLARPAALAAAALALATPMLAQAHDGPRQEACTDRIHDNGTTGALLGGVAGAVIGSNLAHHGGRTGGAVLGGLAGAAVGSNIARSSTKDSCRDRVAYRDFAPPPPPRAYVEPAPAYVYGGYPPVEDEPHDRGLHRGWYKHHHHHDEDDD